MAHLSRLVTRLVIVFLPLGAAGHARAEWTPADAPDVVHVTGLRATPWKSYRAMRMAMEAHEKYKDLAPDAVFSFGVIRPKEQPLPPNFALRVRTPDGTEYPIAMTGRSFTLPILPDGELDGDLVTNLKGSPIRIGIRVDTPGVPAGMDRLGDLRLTCQINRAIARAEDNFLVRLMRPNVCEEASGRWMMLHAQSLSAGGFLVEGTRSAPLERVDTGGVTRYRIPLYDTSWGNDTLVDYRYTATVERSVQFYYRPGN